MSGAVTWLVKYLDQHMRQRQETPEEEKARQEEEKALKERKARDAFRRLEEKIEREMAQDREAWAKRKALRMKQVK